MEKMSDFSLATVDEIKKEIARRSKIKRKKRYGTQKEFAKHIGIPHRSYQEFEIKGNISLENFIKILRGLDSIDELSKLLLPNDIELFESKNSSTKSIKKQETSQKPYSKNFGIEIPDVFK